MLAIVQVLISDVGTAELFVLLYCVDEFDVWVCIMCAGEKKSDDFEQSLFFRSPHF